MNKLQCDLKKITFWLKGLLCSFLFSSALSTQAQILTQEHFIDNPGTEVTISSNNNISKILSQPGIVLDHGSTEEIVKLYISQEGFNYLTEKEIQFSWQKPIPAKIKMKGVDDLFYFKKGDCMPPMDFYPSYEAYEQMMYDFESTYPSICKILEIGTLQSGRKILVAQIGDNIEEQEDEPNFLYSSTMHGDELAGYPMMLMYMDDLLCNYGTDQKITELVNNINIFINPLANPDGAYRRGNNSVDGATRFNSSFTDLNRNFPDPEDGAHPDGREYQEETIIFMQFEEDYDINLACNIHSGIELVNYPWDTFIDRHADDIWWRRVCREYADTVHTHAPQGYFRALDNGITNGYDWYEVQGGRQDFTTFFHRSREMTLELSNVKELDSDQLPDIWSYNKNALYNYMEESLFGLRGSIVDCITKLPIEAEVTVLDHDRMNSSVFSSPKNGSYFRYIESGIFDVEFTAEGYDTILTEVNIVDKVSTRFDVEMCQMNVSVLEKEAFGKLEIKQINNRLVFENLPQGSIYSVSLFNVDGKLILETPLKENTFLLPEDLESRIYLIRLSNNQSQRTEKLFLKKY